MLKDDIFVADSIDLWILGLFNPALPNWGFLSCSYRTGEVIDTHEPFSFGTYNIWLYWHVKKNFQSEFCLCKALWSRVVRPCRLPFIFSPLRKGPLRVRVPATLLDKVMAGD